MAHPESTDRRPPAAAVPGRPPGAAPAALAGLLLASAAALAALAGVLVPASALAAQEGASAGGAAGAWRAVADSSPFRPLDLRAPNRYRGADGRPGPDYWQQRVDYRIDATLDPGADELRGRETIHYVNRSPRTLDHVWMQLDQNICAPGSLTNTLNQPPLVFQAVSFDFSCGDFDGGVTLDSLSIGGREAERSVEGTVMRVELPAPLRPGGATDLRVVWSFRVPPYGAGRMGHDGPLYEMAQWYPRMAVYDDVTGWNHEPYIGAGEFYLEYGSFDVSLTVPARDLVAATGTLLNPDEVLTAGQRRRLEAARSSDTTVAVVTAAEAGTPAARPPGASGTLTWRFHADSVRDFAFAAGPELRWDAGSADGVLVETLYRPSARLWTEANRMARAAIAGFSRHWLRYPYPHATTVEGPIAGMEYPMLTFCPAGQDRHDLQWTIMHEFGHEWFPMVVGSNERLYPWMDEGFNTFIDYIGAAEYFRGTAYGDTIGERPLHLYGAHAVPGQEQPLADRPVEQRDLLWTGYQKPALMLHLLRTVVLGPERFDRAFRAYARDWAFRHPTPADFFRVMRDESGRDLGWFWREWIYSTARLDVAVDTVARREDGGWEVRLSNRGTMVMPVDLEIEYAGGDRSRVHLPVDAWNLGRQFTYRVPDDRRVVGARVDPDGRLPDTDRSDDRWPR